MQPVLFAGRGRIVGGDKGQLRGGEREGGGLLRIRVLGVEVIISLNDFTKWSG